VLDDNEEQSHHDSGYGDSKGLILRKLVCLNTEASDDPHDQIVDDVVTIDESRVNT